MRAVIGIYVICICFVWYTSYAATTTQTITTNKETLPDGTITYNLVIHKTTTNTVSEIKDTLVATSVQYEKLLFSLINAYRKENKNTNILKYSSKLSNIARNYAKQSSDDAFFSHKDKNGHDGRYRLTQWWVKENTFWWELMAEAVDASQAIKTLQSSIKHNAILLEDAHYTTMGVGYYKGTRVIMFFTDKKWLYADLIQPKSTSTLVRKKKNITPIK